jgi:hypothetical protein
MLHVYCQATVDCDHSARAFMVPESSLIGLLLLLQIHGCHCKDCKKSDASNEAAAGGDCFTADDAAGADMAATPFAAAAGAEDNKKKRDWPVRLVTKYIVPPRECLVLYTLPCQPL